MLRRHTRFVQPFDRRETTVAAEAREVRCNPDGSLEGAVLSDHGYPIIGMFFDALGNDPATGIASSAETPLPDPTPGRNKPFPERQHALVRQRLAEAVDEP